LGLSKRFYTLLIVPDLTSRVKRLRFSSRHACLLIGSILFLLAGFSLATYRAIQVQARLERLAGLEVENRDLKLQIQSLADRVDNVNAKLSRINQFNHKVRMLTGLEKDLGGEGTMGIGGPEVSELRLALNRNLDAADAKELRKINYDLENLDHQLSAQELSLQEVQEFLEDRRSIIASTPSICPTLGLVTSSFGMRNSPFTNQRKMHEGMDIAAAIGTLIRAPADGLVVLAGDESGYGRMVAIDHGYGLTTRYGHCSELLVIKGQRVRRGDPIATVGATGSATGPHLHYEIRLNGIPVNPNKYLLD
jgi:murein DD-endopeptidase MepM/ murein hydrolase activator NlpD